MSKIVKLTAQQDREVKRYIYNNFWECVELAKIYDKSGLKNKNSDKNSGDYFGFYNDLEELKGIFLFTNNKRLLLNFIDDDVTKKVDLLKAIKYYKPEHMSGKSDNIILVWRMFERTVKRYKYRESLYMVMEEEREFLKNYCEDDFEVRNANNLDAKKHLNFLLEVEKEFERNHLTINQLQSRIYERAETGEYLFIEKEKKIVSQAFIEDKINAFSQIGGVYTSLPFRGKTYGYKIVKKLCKNILEVGQIPMLAVLKENKPAVSVYEKLYFKAKVQFSIVEIEF